MQIQETKETYILFICKANVGRSQMAEGIYNHLYKSKRAKSIAGCEARKDLYAGKPAESIKDFMISYAGIDISSQKIQYLSDLSLDEINTIEEVIFLYDPTQETICEGECMRDGRSPYEYFKNRGISLRIFPVADPFLEGENTYESIYASIDSLVRTL